jgi:hypothetical protein
MNCEKCNRELIMREPSITMAHCGTDYWTHHGNRRWKPKICMQCRSKVGRHAQRAQGKWRDELEEERKAFYKVTKQAFQSTQD